MSTYIAHGLVRGGAMVAVKRRVHAACPVLFGLLLLATQVASAQDAKDLNFGSEYAAVGYTGVPQRNPVAQLAARLAAGDAQLQFHDDRLHLDSLLAELNIDPGSQVLVFSRTSLQGRLIKAATPRAIYFNDSTYVAWIPGTQMLEIATTDAALGPVFYTLRGSAGTPPAFDRHTGTCLICHDTYSAQGGGVPVLMAKSVLASANGAPIGEAINVVDTTPLEARWGGWYVTGQHGNVEHRGNIVLDDDAAMPADLKPLMRGNIEALAGLGLFDTERYLRATSDIVALLVLEHQVSVQNQLTYVKFKAPAVLGRTGFPEAAAAESWDDLPPRAQTALARMVKRLADAMLLADAAPLADAIAGTSGFEAWFEAQGPRDHNGRSLREFDLQRRLFKYPLSYLIYSAEFDALPPYAKDYVYRAVADALQGRSDAYAHLTGMERRAIHEILIDTKPEFARY